MPELEPMEIIETVCSVCQMPATRVSGQWLHVEFADAVFCSVLRGEVPGPDDEPYTQEELRGLDDRDSDEPRDAAAEQAYESRYGLHREGFTDND